MSVKLNLLPSAKPLHDGARVHLHVYTAETIAEVRLLGTKQLQPGQSALARLKLDDAALVLPDDHFIARQFSPVITIGGGIVIDALEPALRTNRALRSFVKNGFGSGHDFSRADSTSSLQDTRGLQGTSQQSSKTAERLSFLQVLENSDVADVLLARVKRRTANGLSFSEVVAETGWLRTRVESVAAGLIASKELLRFGDVLLSTATVAQLTTAIRAAVDAFHKASPLVAGISREELRERLGASSEIYRGIEDLMVRDKQVEVLNELVRIPGRGVVLRDEEAESKKQIEATFANAGLKVPLLKDVLASLPIDKARAQKIVTLLLRDRVLVKVGDDLVFHRDALDGLRKLVIAQKGKTPKMNVVAFKDLIGVTRKYAIPLLEYLDRERVTRRVGDERVIL
jgi:selenocysteine-specific elongation factor